MNKSNANRLLGVVIVISISISISIQEAIGFTSTATPSIRLHRTNVPSKTFLSTKMTETQGEEDIVEDYDVTCYVVNDEEIITEGEKPHVVCTSEPEDYAWFNGIDPKNMRETDGTMEGAEECVEGESYRGKPEWECE
ncbi:hypothetical protein ACHAXS_004783 [Conticribra weissflogii]